MEENIEEIVGTWKPNTIFVTMWDILQLSAPKNPVTTHPFFQVRKSCITLKKSSTIILSQKQKLIKYYHYLWLNLAFEILSSLL